MKRLRSGGLWAVGFGVLVVLSLDYWSWDSRVRLAALNLPSWVYYFVGLQFVLAAALHRFSKTFWRDPDDAASTDRPPREHE